MKRALYFAAVIGGLGLLGLYAYEAQREAPAAEAATGEAGDVDRVVTVDAVPVAEVTLQEDAVAIGTLRSNESVMVRPELSGRITALNFTEGRRVVKGQLLIQLDPSIVAAELQQAQANLHLAQTNYERTVELRKNNFVSQAAQDQALNNLRVVEATVALAQARVAKMAIRAPFSGVIGIRQVSVGDYVKEGQDLVTLEDTSAFKVDFRLPEMLMSQLILGQQVEVRSDALPGRHFVAVLDAIDPLIDQNGRALVLRARLENPGGVLRPGMFVQTRVILAQHDRALVVPEEAVMAIGGEQRVYLVGADRKVTQHKVSTGLRRNGQVEITEGLRAGDLVVTAGHLKLRPGTPVQISAQAPAATVPGAPPSGVPAAVPNPAHKAS